MPYKIIWETNGVVQKFHGEITMDELEQSNNEMYNDDRYDNLRYGIFDASEVTSVDLNRGHTKELAHTDNVVSTYTKPIKLALIATHPEMCELIDHYIETHFSIGTPWKLKKFGAIEDAREWIGP